jgi:hypothetical protein
MKKLGGTRSEKPTKAKGNRPGATKFEPHNIGNDLGYLYTQDDQGQYPHNEKDDLGGNVGSDLSINDVPQPLINDFSPNIGNQLGHLYKQEPAGDISDNVGADLSVGNIPQPPITDFSPNIGNDLNKLYQQTAPVILSSNIGNDDLGENDITQPAIDDFTPNIGNDLSTQFTQDTAGVMTPNVGNDLGVQYTQDNAGILTPNVGNDLTQQYTQKPIDEFTTNIGNDLSTQFTQDSAGVITPNVGNDMGQSYIQPTELTPESRERIINEKGSQGSSDIPDSGNLSWARLEHDWNYDNNKRSFANFVDRNEEIPKSTNEIKGNNIEPSEYKRVTENLGGVYDNNLQTEKTNKGNDLSENDIEQPTLSNFEPNIGNKLGDVYEQPQSVKKEEQLTGSEDNTKKPDWASSEYNWNYENDKKAFTTFQKNLQEETITKDTQENEMKKSDIQSPVTKAREANLKTLFNNPAPKSVETEKHSIELGSIYDKKSEKEKEKIDISQQIRNKRNIGNDLGNIYNK